MRCRVRDCLILPLILALASPALAQTQQTPDSASTSRRKMALEIREVVEQLQAVRAERRRAQRSHGEAVDRLQRQIDRLEADVDRVDEALADQAQAIERQRASLDEAEQHEARLRQVLAEVRDAAEPVVERMHRRVAHGIPYEREQRAAALERVAEGLAEDPPAAWAGAAQALWDVAADELEAGRSVAMTNRPIHLDGGRRREQAWVLRLGLAGAAFVTEDETTVGVAAASGAASGGASGGEPWQLAPSGAMREAVVQAIRIRRDLAPPALVNLPYRTYESAGATQQEADR